MIDRTASLPPDQKSAVPAMDVGVDMATRHELEQFLFFEARILDERRFDDWYALLADDIHYWMPIRYNRLRRELSKENAAPGVMANFDENKESLRQRVVRLGSGMAWSEDPPSRTRHLVTNVWATLTEVQNEYQVQSCFLTYRNRGEAECDIWVGRRDDLLRRIGERQWQIARRHITLDQATILSKNLSVFF